MIGNTLPANTIAYTCRVCDTAADMPIFVAREMMYGTRESFPYVQCPACDCLQLAEVPDDLGRYYPSNYYSYTEDHAARYHNTTKNLLNRLRDLAALYGPFGPDFPGAVQVPHLRSSFDALARVKGLSRSMRILDIGCGSGQLLYRLANAGFRHLTGVDPFISESIDWGGRLRILKASIKDIDERFDLIILNHSFEHMQDPIATAMRIKDCMRENGTIVLRIPLSDSEAWKHYGVNWFQLDAPRHLFLHTRKSIDVLVRKVGLRVLAVHYDSGPDQFEISERYAEDIPLRGAEAVRARSISPRQHRANARKAAVLNRQGRGDQATFFLSST